MGQSPVMTPTPEAAQPAHVVYATMGERQRSERSGDRVATSSIPGPYAKQDALTDPGDLAALYCRMTRRPFVMSYRS